MAGAELDLLAKVPGISAELDLVIGRTATRVAQAIKDPGDRMQRWRNAGSPLVRRVAFSGSVNAAQAAAGTPQVFFEFDSKPQSGRLWSVRSIVLQALPGAGPFQGTALASVTAAIFVTGQGLANLMPVVGQDAPSLDAVQTALTLPTTQFYSSHQIQVRGGEHLMVAFSGAGVTAAVTFYGQANILEIDDDPVYLLDL